jgi:hypothetical protein
MSWTAGHPTPSQVLANQPQKPGHFWDVTNGDPQLDWQTFWAYIFEGIYDIWIIYDRMVITRNWYIYIYTYIIIYIYIIYIEVYIIYAIILVDNRRSYQGFSPVTWPVFRLLVTSFLFPFFPAISSILRWKLEAYGMQPYVYIYIHVACTYT